MIVPHYTFKIAQIDRNEREVTPYNKDMIINWNVQKGEAFFRETLKTTIKLIGADADYIIDAEYTQKFIFKIIKDSEIYYQGFFYKHDCNIDYQKRTCEFTCITDDDYVDILENYDTQYDLFKIKTDSVLSPTSLTLHKYPILQLINYTNYNGRVFNYIGGRYCNLNSDGDDDGYLGSSNDSNVRWKPITVTNQNRGGQWNIIRDSDLSEGYDSDNLYSREAFNEDSYNIEKIAKAKFILLYGGNEITFKEGSNPEKIFTGPPSRSSLQVTSEHGINPARDLTKFVSMDGNESEYMQLVVDNGLKLWYYSPSQSTHSYSFNMSEGAYSDRWNDEDNPTHPGEYNSGPSYGWLKGGNYPAEGHPDVSIYIRENCVFGRILCDSASLNIGVNSYESEDIISPVSDDFPNLSDIGGTRNYRYCNNKIFTDKIAEIEFITGIADSDIPTNYGFSDKDPEKYFSIPKYDPNLPPDSQLVPTDTTKLYPINQTDWVNTSIWMYIPNEVQYLQDINFDNGSPVPLNNWYYIKNVIERLLIQLTGGRVRNSESQFLFGDAYPITIVNTSFNTTFGKLYLTPITNVLKSLATAPAKKFVLSLKEIMDMLRECFNCYWYISPSDRLFHIEHLYYFTHGNSYNNSQQPPGPSPEPPVPSPEEPPVRDIISEDVTDYIDLYNNKHILYYQSNIKFDLTDFKKRYDFEFTDKSPLKFDEAVISNTLKTLQKEKITIKKFSSDIESMLLIPKKYNPDNIAIVSYQTAIEMSSPKYIKDIEGLSYSIRVTNFNMFWGSLLNFRMYDMEVSHPNVEINQVLGFAAQDYYLARDYKKGMIYSLKMPLPDNIPFDFILTNRLIKTDLGIGIIEDYSFDIFTRQATFTIKYEPNINLEK